MTAEHRRLSNRYDDARLQHLVKETIGPKRSDVID